MNEELREKVVRGLELLHKRLLDASVHDRIAILDANMVSDAIALLKSQEPVKPVLDIDTWKCGNCKHTLEHQQLLGDNVLFHEQYNYCPECGRAVKWE